MSEVTGIRVLVAGGTSGLGRAMSAELLAGGAQVVLTGRDAARAAAAAELASLRPGRAVGVAMDVRDEQSVEEGIAAASDVLGGIDVLVKTTMRRAGFAPYGPSRAATDSLSHVMAADLAGTGVTVNLLSPGGATATGMDP